MAMECCICANVFNDRIFKPVVGTCGHSLCMKCCRAVPNKKCPLCQKDLAFIDELLNFQLIEQMQISKQQEIELSAKSNAFESVKKQNSQLEKELENMRKKLNTILTDEERSNSNRCKCSECGSMVDKERCRLCTTCSVEQEIVRMEAETVKILDVDETDKVVFCAECALEGIHKGHNTLLYTKMKFKHQIEKIVDDCESVKTVGCSKEFVNLHSVRDDFLATLKQISVAAETSTNPGEYEVLLSECRTVKEKYELAITTLEGQVQTSVQTIKFLGSRLLSAQLASVKSPQAKPFYQFGAGPTPLPEGGKACKRKFAKARHSKR